MAVSDTENPKSDGYWSGQAEGSPELDAARRELAKGRIFRPLGKLTPFLKLSLWANIIVMVPMAILLTWMTFDRGTISDPILSIVSEAIWYLDLLYIGLTCLAYVAYIRFMHRAMNNVHVLDGPDGLISPVGTWLWFIVPVANLWKPFEATMQIWWSSRGHAGLDEALPISAKIWWGCFLLYLILGSFLSLIPLELLMIELIQICLAIVLTLALLRYVSGIADAQAKMAEQSIEDVFA